MPTIKEAQAEAAIILGTAEARELYKPLLDLQDSLPAGITVNITKGEITFLVRSSYTNSASQQVKVGLGTFTDLEKAVTALVKWKTEQMMKKLNLSIMDTVKSALKIVESKRIKAIAGAKISAYEGVSPEGYSLTFYEILDKIPPFMIPSDGDYEWHDFENNRYVKIPAPVISSWWRKEELLAEKNTLEQFGLCENWKENNPDSVAPDYSDKL